MPPSHTFSDLNGATRTAGRRWRSEAVCPQRALLSLCTARIMAAAQVNWSRIYQS